jgi:hypothetical protein
MTTQASPGLNVAGPVDSTPGISGIPGIAPNASLLSATSNGQLRRNTQMTGFGLQVGISITAGSHPNPTVGVLPSDCGRTGTHTALAANGGSQNGQACGGNSLGAGGMNQTENPGPGHILSPPLNMPESAVTFAAQPTFGG